MMGSGTDGAMIGTWLGPLGMFIWPLILVAVVIAVAWLVRSATQGGGREPMPPRRSSALDILEERYARGEFGRDEYEQKKRDLSGLVLPDTNEGDLQARR